MIGANSKQIMKNMRNISMKRFTLLAVCFWTAIQLSSAATIPSGTILVVRTNQTIDSNSPVGSTFSARLSQDVNSGRTVLVRSGAQVNGRIDAARRRSSQPLVLNITQFFHNGRWIPVRTVEGSRQDGARFTSRRGTPVGPSGFFKLPSGTTMRFQLARSVDLGGR